MAVKNEKRDDNGTTKRVNEDLVMELSTMLEMAKRGEIGGCNNGRGQGRGGPEYGGGYGGHHPSAHLWVRHRDSIYHGHRPQRAPERIPVRLKHRHLYQSLSRAGHLDFVVPWRKTRSTTDGSKAPALGDPLRWQPRPAIGSPPSALRAQ
jgi:hypothetical protein